MYPRSTIAQAVQLIDRVRRDHPVLVAIDGGGGAGKSTLAAELRDELRDAAIVRVDDFYRPLHGDAQARSSPEYAYRHYLEVERLRLEALSPLNAGRSARYQPRDWTSDELRGRIEVEPRPTVLVEGVYSSRPELRDLVAIAIFVDTPQPRRIKRIRARGGADSNWIDPWFAAEDWYFDHLRPRDSADLIVAGFAAC